MKSWNRIRILAVCLSAMLLGGCGGVTEEMLAERETAIELMEQGDYEGAAAIFDGLIEEATSVTEFELDVLKYRAEAEFLMEDYAAAVHTYRTLMEVDEERPEYCYVSSIAYSRDGQTAEAKAMLERGMALDEKMEAAGVFEAMYGLAECYERDGMIVEAKAVYLELIEKGAGTTRAYNRLMLMDMDAGNYESALELAAAGLVLTDDLARKELRFNEAVCYEFLGDYAKALELFRAYAEEFGSDERAEHEIAFLKTR